jgi:hypothetical protein
MAGLVGSRPWRSDGKAHRAHQTHLVDLFSHVNFHFISAGFPGNTWRGEHEIASVVFERNLHRILSNRNGGIEAGYRFRVAASDHLESLIMLVKEEHNKNRRTVSAEPVGRFHRYDFVRTLGAQFLVKSFRCRNGAEQALRRSVEVVGGDVLGAVLKIGDGGILGDRQLLCQSWGTCKAAEDYEPCDEKARHDCFRTLVDGSCQGEEKADSYQLSPLNKLPPLCKGRLGGVENPKVRRGRGFGKSVAAVSRRLLESASFN